MANEQYQSLIRSDAATIRGAAMATEDDALVSFLDGVTDAELPALLGNLGGHDIREFSREGLRDLFGMVLQDAWLYNASIMENIRAS